MKIAYIVSMFPCWSETFILNELIEHKKSGVDLDIYSIKKCSENLFHDEVSSFIDKTTYPFSFFNPILILLHFFLFLKNPFVYSKTLYILIFLKKKDLKVKLKSLGVFLLSPIYIIKADTSGIQHLHAHFATYPALLAWIINRFTGISFSFTAHAHDIYVNQDLLLLLCENASRIVAISKYNKNFIIEKVGKHVKEKIITVHCGINVKKFAFKDKIVFDYEPEKTLNILSIGRLSGIKGFEYLLDSLSLLNSDGVPFKCRIIGDGPLRKKLEDRVEVLSLEGRVDFLGVRKTEEIPNFLDEADVFVLACARGEKEGHDGIPLVFMEAMAHGVPVIGTRLSGIPELIKHKETGLCALPEDSESLKETLKYLINNPEKASMMIENAREIISNEFDIMENSVKLREVFGQIIEGKTES